MRAPIIRSVSPAKMKPSANAPRSCVSAARTASTGLTPFFSMSSTRCSTISVSVSVLKTAPFFVSASRSSRKFSMMPLWTTATRSVACGCALFSVGLPWVAQRVWPMPVWPASGFAAQPRFEILQLAFGAAAIEMVAFQRGDACGIVTAIFKPLEQIHQLLRNRSAPQNADNAAHAVQYPQI